MRQKVFTGNIAGGKWRLLDLMGNQVDRPEYCEDVPNCNVVHILLKNKIFVFGKIPLSEKYCWDDQQKSVGYWVEKIDSEFYNEWNWNEFR